MRSDEFLKLLRRMPFRPFRLQLSNNLVYDMRHPEMALVERSTVWIYVPVPKLPIPLEHRQVIVTLLHIVQVDFIEPATSPSNN